MALKHYTKFSHKSLLSLATLRQEFHRRSDKRLHWRPGRLHHRILGHLKSRQLSPVSLGRNTFSVNLKLSFSGPPKIINCRTCIYCKYILVCHVEKSLLINFTNLHSTSSLRYLSKTRTHHKLPIICMCNLFYTYVYIIYVIIYFRQ